MAIYSQRELRAILQQNGVGMRWTGSTLASSWPHSQITPSKGKKLHAIDELHGSGDVGLRLEYS
jgi:hypothetical protein